MIGCFFQSPSLYSSSKDVQGTQTLFSPHYILTLWLISSSPLRLNIMSLLVSPTFVLPVHPLSWAPDYWHNCASTQSPGCLMVIQMIFFPKMDTWFSLFNSPPSSLPQLSAWPQYSLNIYTFIPVSRHLHFSLQCISSCNHFSTMQSATVMHSHRCVHLLLFFIWLQKLQPVLSPMLKSRSAESPWAGLPWPLPFSPSPTPL